MRCAQCQAEVEANIATAYKQTAEDEFEPMCEECLGQVVLSLLRWMEMAGLAICTMDEQRTIQ